MSPVEETTVRARPETVNDLVQTAAELVRRRADDPHVALRSDEGTMTWATLVEQASTRAHFVEALRDPDRPFHVGVLLENCFEFVLWVSAAALGGSTAVGINSTRRGEELARDIRHSDCQFLVTDTRHAHLIDGLDIGIAPEHIFYVDQDNYTGRLDAFDGRGLPEADLDADTLIFLLFTSGSTGHPKAVRCTQGRVARTAHHTAANFEITADMTTYLAMPLFHGNSLFSNWAPALAVGATISMRPKFSASHFLPDVRRFGANYFNYVGRALAYILAVDEQPDDADNPLTLCFGTEASLPDRQKFMQRFGCDVIESFGGTENGLSFPPKRSTPPGSIGRPAPGDLVEVRHPETGVECPRAVFDENGLLLNGEEAIGEIVGLNTAHRFEGYYKNPIAANERVRGEEYWTGDLGYRAADGYFYFAGRGGDMVRVDSENFSAAQVEAVLSRYPGFRTIVVYPVHDARTGDQVMATFEPTDPGAFDLDHFVSWMSSQRDMGVKWTPKFLRMMDQLPQTANGKIRKVALRDAMWAAEDPVWWRPDRSGAFVELTDEAEQALVASYVEYGRAHLLPATLAPTPETGETAADEESGR